MRTEWIVLAVVVVIALGVIVTFNRLVRQRNLVREGWSGIDVQLRRRTDLVPNLVEAVKGYAAHERALYENVAALRSMSIAANNVPAQAEAERRLQGSLAKLLALAEAYPQLKADGHFLQLQQQLVEIEDNLQMARRYYNGVVRDLNISIATFPNGLVAWPFGFREQPFFELDDRAEAEAPVVSLEKKT